MTTLSEFTIHKRTEAQKDATYSWDRIYGRDELETKTSRKDGSEAPDSILLSMSKVCVIFKKHEVSDGRPLLVFHYNGIFLFLSQGQNEIFTFSKQVYSNMQTRHNNDNLESEQIMSWLIVHSRRFTDSKLFLDFYRQLFSDICLPPRLAWVQIGDG